ncbi:MAG: flagellin, partial [candidate division Zixibacteria bacterium]
NDSATQAAYDTAAQSLVSVYNDTIENAQYNGSQTLDGSEGALADIDDLTGVDLTTAEAANASIDLIDAAIRELDQASVEVGATQKNELEAQKASLEVQHQNLSAAESQVRDADIGETVSLYVSSMIRNQIGLSLMAHAAMQSQSMAKLLIPSN